MDNGKKTYNKHFQKVRAKIRSALDPLLPGSTHTKKSLEANSNGYRAMMRLVDKINKYGR